MAFLPHQGNRWWIFLLVAVYLLTLCFNAQQDAFGPADSGLRYTGRLPDHRPLQVESVVRDSPLELAGVRAGDVIEAVAGRAVVGQTDWFLARAHFERSQPTEIRIRRGEQHLNLQFTIMAPNWTTWHSGGIAFYAARVVVLLAAIVLAFKRPDQLSALLVALIFAMIAVGEAFPPSGWGAALRHLPAILSIPIAVASVSWLLIAVVWFSLCAVFPRPLFARRWSWAFVLAPVAIFLPLILVSTVAVIYRPAVLDMPTSFLDSHEIRIIQGIWGVIPSLFINPWPFYLPARQEWLLELWVAVSSLNWIAGYLILVVMSLRVREEPERRRMRTLAFALLMIWMVAGHNVLVRNWGNVFGTTPPTVFSSMGLVIEAIAFSFLALSLTYTVLKHRVRSFV